MKAHTVLTALVWLVALFLFYALTEDQPYLEENVAAGVLAVLGTILVMIAARNWGTRGACIPPSALPRLRTIPGDILKAVPLVSAAIIGAAIRGRILHGRIETQPFTFGELHDPADVGRRAIESYAVCIAPNTILVEFEPDSNQILIHPLQ